MTVVCSDGRKSSPGFYIGSYALSGPLVGDVVGTARSERHAKRTRDDILVMLFASGVSPASFPYHAVQIQAQMEIHFNEAPFEFWLCQMTNNQQKQISEAGTHVGSCGP